MPLDGSIIIKSITICDMTLGGTGTGVIVLDVFLIDLSLAIWHTRHVLTYLHTDPLISGQKNLLAMCSTVLFIPMCPDSPFAVSSSNYGCTSMHLIHYSHLPIPILYNFNHQP